MYQTAVHRGERKFAPVERVEQPEVSKGRRKKKCAFIEGPRRSKVNRFFKLKCYVKPMKDPLGVSPSKGNQGTTQGKENILLTLLGVGRVTVDLIRRSWVRFPQGPDSNRGQKNFFFTSCGSLIPFTRANAQWVFHGLHIAL